MSVLRVLIADHRADRRAAVMTCLPGIDVLPPACNAAEAHALTRSLRPSVVLLADDLPPDATALRPASCWPKSSPSCCCPRTCARTPCAGPCGPERGTFCPGACPPPTSPPPCAACPLSPSRCPRCRARRVLLPSPGPKAAQAERRLPSTSLLLLARDTGQPTVLLDLHTQFADAALLLGLSPRRTLADWASLDPDALDARFLDARFLEDYAETHESGLFLLAGAAAPLALHALSAETVNHVLTLLECECASVIIDLPPVIDGPTLAALSRADDVLLVAGLFDLPTLAASRRWLDALLGAHIRPENVRVVFNRVAPRSRLSVADGEQVLGLPAGAAIPNDGKLVPASVNAGVPFVLSHPGCAPARSIAALARTLSETEAPHALPRLRLFGRNLPRRSAPPQVLTPRRVPRREG